MKCKKCGAMNEDYLEYCEKCAAPLTPDDQAENMQSSSSEDYGYKSYVAATGETPPAWGFVKAPQWPKPDFDANTVSEDDIPEDYFKSFNPHPAEAERPACSEYKAESALPPTNKTRESRENGDSAYDHTVRIRSNPSQEQPYAKQTAQTPVSASAPHAHAYSNSDVMTQADIPDSDINPPRNKAQKAHAQPDNDFEDYGAGYKRTRPRSDNRRNLLFIAMAAALVVLIAVFGIILINTRYGGSFDKFISCTFQGDPILRTPTVEATTTKSGDPGYLITIYTKRNYYFRFTAGSVVREAEVTGGSVNLSIPEKIWIPDEPLDSSTLTVTPDIVIISPKGDETPVEFDEPITITVPTIQLTMSQPTVSDFTVDSATVPIAGVVSDNTASIYVGEDQVAVDEAGNFSTNYTLPGEGTYTLEIKAQKNGCMTAVETYNITYGAATTPVSPDQGNVAFSVNDDVKRYGTSDTMTVAGTMEQGATVSVSGVELDGTITQDPNAGTYSFTIKTADVGIYEAVITVTKDDAASSTTLLLEHQPDLDTYVASAFVLDYDRIVREPNHQQAYKVVGTITEIRQTAPYVIARIQTSAGDIIFCYISGKATIEPNDGKTYELYADPYGTDTETGLPYMHAWFVLKKSN